MKYFLLIIFSFFFFIIFPSYVSAQSCTGQGVCGISEYKCYPTGCTEGLGLCECAYEDTPLGYPGCVNDGYSCRPTACGNHSWVPFGDTCQLSSGSSMGGGSMGGGMGTPMNTGTMSTPINGYTPSNYCNARPEGPYCDCVNNTAYTYNRMYPWDPNACPGQEYVYTSIIPCGTNTCDDSAYSSCTCTPPPGQTPTPTPPPLVTPSVTITPPPLTPTPSTVTPAPLTCDPNEGVCGCKPGTGCQDGPNRDFRCCHRECRSNACATVFGSGSNDAACPSGSDGQACGTSTPGCFVGKACSSCGAGGAGNCSDCSGGWCNGGVCSSCTPPIIDPVDSCFASFSCSGFTAANASNLSVYARGLARETDYNYTTHAFSTNNELTIKPGDTVWFSTDRGGVNDPVRGIMGLSDKQRVRTQFITREITSNILLGSCIMSSGQFRSNWCQAGISKIGWDNRNNSSWPYGYWPYSYVSTPSGFSAFDAQVVPAKTFSVSTVEAGVQRIFSGTCNRVSKQQSCCAVSKTSNGPPERWTCTDTGEDPDTCSSRTFSPAECTVDDLGTSAAPDELARSRTMRMQFNNPGTYVVEATEQFACGTGGDNNSNPCAIRVKVQPTNHEIRGYVYIDANRNGKKDAGEDDYTSFGVTHNIGASARINKIGANFTISDVPANPSGYDVRVYLVGGLPPGFQIWYPKLGSGFYYHVTPGLPCSSNPIIPASGTSGDGSCDASTGNIINLNFGITESNPWIQFTGLDVRVDQGFSNITNRPPKTVDNSCTDVKSGVNTGFSSVSSY